MSQRKTVGEFIEQSKKIHGDKYDYTLTDYKNNNTKVQIICHIHGSFTIRPNDHLSKKVGCNKCNNAGKSKNDNMRSKILERFKNIHKDKYDYSLMNYVNFDTKINIICPIHGIFNQTPHHHVNGHGCSKCKGLCRLTTEEFITKSKNIHGDRYDYSLTNYKNNRTKIKVLCKIHKEFEVTPNDHMSKKSGCPTCQTSKGEISVENYLKENGIKFVKQHIFKDCRNQLPLPFDFYLPDFNTCIEYDGALHFKSIEWFGGDETLLKTKKRDYIKNEYCKKNGIKLIRIKYDDKRGLSEIFEFVYR
jgi:hypothetical protein